jgi:hypothetical protein
MRHPFAFRAMPFVKFLVMTFALFAFTAGGVQAQTSSPTVSKRQQFRQDSDACAKEGIDRHRVDLFADCMSKKDAGRKAAEKQRRAEEAAKRKAQRTERFEAAMQANRETNLLRIEQEKAARARREDCKKQAKEQKLHFMKRLRFIENCVKT